MTKTALVCSCVLSVLLGCGRQVVDCGPTQARRDVQMLVSVLAGDESTELHEGDIQQFCQGSTCCDVLLYEGAGAGVGDVFFRCGDIGGTFPCIPPGGHVIQIGDRENDVTIFCEEVIERDPLFTSY